MPRSIPELRRIVRGQYPLLRAAQTAIGPYDQAIGPITPPLALPDKSSKGTGRTRPAICVSSKFQDQEYVAFSSVPAGRPEPPPVVDCSQVGGLKERRLDSAALNQVASVLVKDGKEGALSTLIGALIFSAARCYRRRRSEVQRVPPRLAGLARSSL
jgi:hypothetical protein